MKDYKTVIKVIVDVQLLIKKRPCTSSLDGTILSGLDSCLTILEVWNTDQDKEIEDMGKASEKLNGGKK